MSLTAMRAWEEHSQATGSTYTVGKQLAIWAQPETHLVWAENPRLARACRLSVRQVQRALRSLEIAGEIVRQPPQPGRRRVFLVDPAHAGQMQLFAGRDDKLSPLGGDTVSPGGDIQGRACMKGVKGGTTPPKAPPRGGGHAPDLPRRSRSRRRRRGPASAPEAVACVHPAAAAEDRDRLQQTWAMLEPELRAAIGDAPFAMWLAGAHLHDVDPLTLAVGPQQLAWVAPRYGRIINRATGSEISLVACEAIHDRVGALADA